MNPPSPVYVDNNATTPPVESVFEAMRPFLGACYANPSSPYSFARRAGAAVEAARAHVAGLIGVSPGEIHFTSGGTEANNAILYGVLRARPDRPHLVLTSVEHACVREAAERLAEAGVRITRLPVNTRGEIDLLQLESMISDKTALVSVMAANNETGVRYPLAEAARLAHARGALFHTDAVQAVGKTAVAAARDDIDYLAASAHKFHGPKGVGFVYARAGAPWTPLLVGGDQEFGRRAGTENVAGIAGLGEAARLAAAWLAGGGPAAVAALRDRFEQRLRSFFPDLRVMGYGAPRLCNTSQMLLSGVEAEALIALLDMDGLCCSSGSACAAGAHEPSPVLQAMGCTPAEARGALRISLSRFTRADDVEYLVERLVYRVHDLLRQVPGTSNG